MTNKKIFISCDNCQLNSMCFFYKQAYAFVPKLYSANYEKKFNKLKYTLFCTIAELCGEFKEGK